METQYFIRARTDRQLLGLAFGQDEQDAISSFIQIAAPVGVNHSDLLADTVE